MPTLTAINIRGVRVRKHIALLIAPVSLCLLSFATAVSAVAAVVVATVVRTHLLFVTPESATACQREGYHLFPCSLWMDSVENDVNPNSLLPGTHARNPQWLAGLPRVGGGPLGVDLFF